MYFEAVLVLVGSLSHCCSAARGTKVLMCWLNIVFIEIQLHNYITFLPMSSYVFLHIFELLLKANSVNMYFEEALLLVSSLSHWCMYSVYVSF